MATLSFHAGTEGKTKRGNLKGVLNHTLRKTMDKHKNHSNEKIDVTKTKDNIDWVQDGRSLEELVDERLEKEYKGKKKMRSDAVVLREVIVQPSADVFVGLSEAEKQQKAFDFTQHSLLWFATEFGVENVMAASVHMDETNPHAHIMVMPMTEDGRMSQKEFFKGPTDFKRQHREYREFMNGRGWDFDLENKYESVDGVSLPKYKANAKEIEKMRLEQKAMVEELKANPDVRKDVLEAVRADIYDNVLSDEQERLKEREKALNDREAQMLADKKSFKKKADDWQQQLREKYTEKHAELSAKNESWRKNYKKHEAIANASALAILEGDPFKEELVKDIKKNGLLHRDPVQLQSILSKSLKDANSGIARRRINNNINVVKREKDDGFDL